MKQSVGNKKYSLIYVVLVQAFLCIIVVHGQEKNIEIECKSCLEHHYQSARDSIIKVWTIVDILRSITITPQARATFAHQMFNDSVVAMHDMAALANSCRFCTDYYKRNAADLVYLEEILGYLIEAFEAVFSQGLSGEEKLLQAVMTNIMHSMGQIRKQVGIQAYGFTMQSLF
jgi:hypothetical protein